MRLLAKLLAAGVLLAVFYLGANAQHTATKVRSTVDPLQLTIGYSMTTNLIFPYAIKGVDRGSKDVLVQKAKGVENILQVKAASDTLKETNLTVVTADGALYSFLLNYGKHPSILNFNLGIAEEKAKPVALLTSNGDTEARVQGVAANLAFKKPVIRSIKDNKFDISLKLSGIYIQDEIIYFQLQLENHSNISYGIDQLRLSILDRKKSTRTASQEIELQPTYVSGNVEEIAAQSVHTVVFAVPKFTIPDQKYLAIQLMEQNGGRHLSLKTNNRFIINAIPVQ